ncbi:MAG: SRPBCC family protein [Luteolibacter sp.]|uniref:SRPBCC family protein n=1 Tax=Luteolibacter sp. TaxID=1962973 RepID=UPI0032668033
MPKFQVHKSIFVESPVKRVYDSVRDFKQWPAWSPWLIAEPDSRMDYSADGKSYAWDGKITGSGEMKIIGENPQTIDYQLTFLKPWKSVNSARFLFADRNGGTEVTWTMEGSLPFFMFWMKSMMAGYVGADYQRGLMMLKAVIETGSNPSKLDFIGLKSFPGFHYVGVKTRCPIADIAANMQRDMAKLTQWLGTSGHQPSGKPFSICHKWDLGKGTTDYTLAFPFTTTPTGLSNDFVSGAVPACKVYQVRHTGPYRFLGNAWAAGVMHGRAKVYTPDKKIDAFEVYENDPTAVPENELVTILHFPVK